MQVVFVHGVNNRDETDGAYARDVTARTDRLNRLAFGGNATIRNPYWGRFGRPGSQLRSVPTARSAFETLGTTLHPPALEGDVAPEVAAHDLREIVGSLSIRAIRDATTRFGERQRREVEDRWMVAAEFADIRPRPAWLTPGSSLEDVAARLEAEVDATVASVTLGIVPNTFLPSFDANDLAARRLRDWSSGFLARFLGDAFMFFSRREAGHAVRQEIASSLVDAARVAHAGRQPLVLVGHSMGGSILHDMLTDQEQVRAIESQLEQPLRVDLFLSVGTQVGLFAELGQFTAPRAGQPLAVRCENYWNVFDYADTLAFVCGPFVSSAVDLEVNTAGGVLRAHSAYFDNALFYRRLGSRLRNAGLTA